MPNEINKTELKRTLINDLIAWKSKRKRKPLILQGARQVGKSWLLQKFGEVAFDNYVVVNIDRDVAIRNLFSQTKDPKRLVEQISLIKGQPVLPETTLLIFDEIQDCDEVLNSLKYFKEDAPEYAVACAGSLLGVAMRKKGRSFPVGQVDFMTLYPLSFAEFLNATDQRLYDTLLAYHQAEALPDILLDEFQEKLKIYMAIGGMPEAVVDWIETRDLSVVDETLTNILKSYPLDFSKYASSAEVIRIQQVWNSMSNQLSKDNKKFKYSEVQKGARAREYETAVEWLCAAGLTHKVCNTETVKIPIKAYENSSVFKLYLNDVGLLRMMFNLDSNTIMEGNNLFTEFKGIIAENYVLISLLQQGISPMYWSSGNQAEIEFIMEQKGKIIPIEVKSGKSVTAKSLSEFRKKHSPELAVRLLLKNLQFRDGLLNLPLPFADKLSEYITSK